MAEHVKPKRSLWAQNPVGVIVLLVALVGFLAAAIAVALGASVFWFLPPMSLGTWILATWTEWKR